MREVAIIGVGQSQFGKFPEKQAADFRTGSRVGGAKGRWR